MTSVTPMSSSSAMPAWLKASAPVLVDLGLWDDFGH